MTADQSIAITIVAVHPAVVIVETGGQQAELPISWFPEPPKTGQSWAVSLAHESTDQEKIDQLNAYLKKE